MPRVSIILATHNEPRYLREAIQSVLNQSYADFGFIIVNDASPYPETEEIIRSFSDPRIRYIKNSTNLGAVRTPNVGLAVARGEFIARIDDDDAWLDTKKLEKQVALLNEHPECVIVGSNIVVVDRDTDRALYETRYPLSDSEIRASIFAASPFAHSAVLYRREPVAALGGYDERLRRVEDYDLWLRLGSRGTFANLPETMVKWRSPSRKIGTLNRLRLTDHRARLGVLWRHRGQYPGFWAPYVLQCVKLPMYWILCLWR